VATTGCLHRPSRRPRARPRVVQLGARQGHTGWTESSDDEDAAVRQQGYRRPLTTHRHGAGIVPRRYHHRLCRPNERRGMVMPSCHGHAKNTDADKRSSQSIIGMPSLISHHAHRDIFPSLALARIRDLSRPGPRTLSAESSYPAPTRRRIRTSILTGVIPRRCCTTRLLDMQRACLQRAMEPCAMEPLRCLALSTISAMSQRRCIPTSSRITLEGDQAIAMRTLLVIRYAWGRG